MSITIMGEKHITLDLYFENGVYGIYLGDNNGGSGITITGKTPEDVARDIAPYIADYFYENDKENEG